MFSSLGSMVVKGRWVVIFVSVAVAAIAALLAPSVSRHLDSGGFTGQDFESYKAQQTIGDHFGSSQQMIILFTAKDGSTAASPAFHQAVSATLSGIRSDQSVTSIIDYYNTSSPAFVSLDGRRTYAVIGIKGSLQDAVTVVNRLRPQLTSPTLQVDIGGEAATNADLLVQTNKDLAVSERVSFLLLAILLVVVFRSLVAATLPILLGGFGVVGALLVLRGLTYFTTISQFSVNVIILLGLGLSIDYSLFMVSRFREELLSQPTKEALVGTFKTAGRTVFFSGLTVIISLLGLMVFPINFLKSMGIGASAAVAVAVIGALTILPAVMAVLGNNVNALSFGRVRTNYLAIKAGQATAPEHRTFWYQVARFAMRFPLLTTAVVVIPLLFVGHLTWQAKFSSPDYRNLPPGTTSRIVAQSLSTDFPGAGSNRIEVVIHTPTGNPVDLAAYLHRLRGLAGITGVTPATAQQVPGYEYLNVSTNAAYDAPTARDLVAQIRATGHPADWQVLVGGQTAELVDLLDSLKHYSVYAALLVAGALVLLLWFMLRSAVVPLQALFMNILSLSATFGILVWVFQQGHLQSWLDFTSVGALDATQPVLIFGIAFGLSMDYSVFLLSRIKEQYDVTGNIGTAIAEGVQKTGTIITSAALLFIVVVGSFATSKIALVKEVGMGLGIAVFIDAFLIRMLLVPAIMRMLGAYNWWTPGRHDLEPFVLPPPNPLLPTRPDPTAPAPSQAPILPAQFTHIPAPGTLYNPDPPPPAAAPPAPSEPATTTPTPAE